MARRYLPAAAFVLIAAVGGTHCLAEDTGTVSEDTAPAAPAAANPTPQPGSLGSLYERLGGVAKITAVVGETIDKLVSSPRTSRTFDKVDVKHVKEMLVEQICSLTGGGCTYDGVTMQDVHGGQGITSAEFYQLTEALRATMRNYDIPLSVRNELLAALTPAKPAT